MCLLFLFLQAIKSPINSNCSFFSLWYVTDTLQVLLWPNSNHKYLKKKLEMNLILNKKAKVVWNHLVLAFNFPLIRWPCRRRTYIYLCFFGFNRWIQKIRGSFGTFLVLWPTTLTLTKNPFLRSRGGHTLHKLKDPLRAGTPPRYKCH